jgi:hypothetical protein
VGTFELNSPPKQPVPDELVDKTVSIQRGGTATICNFLENLDVADGSAMTQENWNDENQDTTLLELVDTPCTAAKTAKSSNLVGALYCALLHVLGR